jgi:hypothetical protein
MAVEGGEMFTNGEPARSDASCSEAGVAPPSCYRVSVVSGSLEVSARLKNADDLELLLKVLEANKALFQKADRSTTETVMVLAAKSADRSETNGLAKADQQTQPSAKTDRLANGILTP